MTDHLSERVISEPYHLPECPFRADHATLPQTRSLICICDELRACEQRMANKYLSHVQHDIRFGREEGLREAEAAVAAIPECIACEIECQYCNLRDALAAIRELKEKA